MNISIGEKKVFGGAAPRRVRLRDYRRPGGVTGGVPMSLAPRLKWPPKSGELQVSMSTRDRERPPKFGELRVSMPSRGRERPPKSTEHGAFHSVA